MDEAQSGFIRSLTSFFMLALCALAIAAIWSILSMISGGLGAYFAPVCAFVLVWLSGAFGFRSGAPRAFVATVMTLLCIGYQSFLFAAGTVAGLMGLSLNESVRSIGAELTISIIRAHTSQSQLICYGLALVLAFLLGWNFRASTLASTPTKKRPT
jgi:hypothetical protein